MKKKGSACDYTAAKNRELVAAFNRLERRRKRYDLVEVFSQVAAAPASRFFISEERAYALLRRFYRTGAWGIDNPLRVEMMEEIRLRAERILRRDPAVGLNAAVCDAVNSPAPKFYLTPGTCRTIVYGTIHDAACGGGRPA